MEFDIQPTLEHDEVILHPLQEEDFEALYAVAADPLVWEQHPNKDRWRRDVFRTFFEGAMKSRGAFKIVDKATGRVAGSTRIYDFDEEENRYFMCYSYLHTLKMIVYATRRLYPDIACFYNYRRDRPGRPVW